MPVNPSLENMAIGAQPQIAVHYVYNPATDIYEALRTPTVWKSVSLANTGNIWTPASGKKFRLMGWDIDFPADCLLGSSGELLVKLQDGSGNDMGISFRVYCPNTIPANAFGDTHYTHEYRNNGRLSAAADRVLVANFSAALVTGNAQIDVWGTEE